MAINDPYGALFGRRGGSAVTPQQGVMPRPGVNSGPAAATPAATPAAGTIDPALAARYRARGYIRNLMQGAGRTALEDQSRTFGRQSAGLNDSLVSRGLWSTTLVDALHNRQTEAQTRSRGALQEQIATGQAQLEQGLDSGIADQLSHNEDRAQNYSFLGSSANAQEKAQKKSSLFGFLGNIGGGLLGALPFFSGGGGSSGGLGGDGSVYGMGGLGSYA